MYTKWHRCRECLCCPTHTLVGAGLEAPTALVLGWGEVGVEVEYARRRRHTTLLKDLWMMHKPAPWQQREC